MVLLHCLQSLMILGFSTAGALQNYNYDDEKLTVSSTSHGAADFVVSKEPIQGIVSYRTITDATKALWATDHLNGRLVTIFIYGGVYEETLFYNRSGITVFRGYSDHPDDPLQNKVIIKNNLATDTQAGDKPNSASATLHSTADYLRMYNIDLTNVYGKTKDYASLGFAVGHKGYASFYTCRLLGNQDTLDLNAQTNVFVYNSVVAGSIDFIWGAGSGYFLNSTIVPNTAGASITAQKRFAAKSTGGLVFDKCWVKAEAGVPKESVYLGRPYSEFARVVWIGSYMDESIHPLGWTIWSTSAPQTGHVLFGEFANWGPGAGSRATRAPYSQELRGRELIPFQLRNFFSAHGVQWINFSHLKVPFFNPARPGTIAAIRRG